MRTCNPDDVINGSWGEVWIDNDYMAQTTALEATIKLNKTSVSQTGTLNEGQKVTGTSGSGTIKLNHVSSYFKTRILKDINAGKSTSFTIISNLDDPTVNGNERVKLTGCTFDEVKVIDWEAGKLGEESYPFTFEKAEMIDTIPD